jgi:hypothetical protein
MALKIDVGVFGHDTDYRTSRENRGDALFQPFVPIALSLDNFDGTEGRKQSEGPWFIDVDVNFPLIGFECFNVREKRADVIPKWRLFWVIEVIEVVEVNTWILSEGRRREAKRCARSSRSCCSLVINIWNTGCGSGDSGASAGGCPVSKQRACTASQTMRSQTPKMAHRIRGNQGYTGKTLVVSKGVMGH